MRSSYSNIIREAQDGSAALFDRHGNVVAQAELIPMQLGPMSDIFRACAAVIPPETLRAGRFLHQQRPLQGRPAPSGRVHLFADLLWMSELVGFAGSVTHHLDLGGGNPGLTPDAMDVHAEGIIFPPSVYNYRPRLEWRAAGASRRPPISARPTRPSAISTPSSPPTRSGRSGCEQLCRRYGPATVMQAMTDLIGYSERRFRAALWRRSRDGDYYRRGRGRR